ncbi:GGDEF domain-containing protein [Desulfonatronovibrio hydrogenovorans]|uniref:GGDEF domain-containing protein n=1 Tax=Desulfonatronovibrio hydrogenovorans TaxID=53245 RepID=UPI0004921FD9|nr:GGDEF domain-containing protein [Desulfonatronovibrio hydrogenovorans]
MRGAPKKVIKSRWEKIGFSLLKLINPSDWNLSFRFIVIPAIIILLMVLLIWAFFSRSMSHLTREHLTQRLELTGVWLDSQISEKFRLVEFQSARLSEDQNLVNLFNEQDQTGTYSYLRSGLDPVKQTQGFSSLDICVYLDPEEFSPGAGWNCPVRDRILRPFLEQAWTVRETGHEKYVDSYGLSRIMVFPVLDRMETVGVFAVRLGLGPLAASLDRPRGTTLALVVHNEYHSNLAPWLVQTGFGSWTAYDSRHGSVNLPSKDLSIDNHISLEKNQSFLLHSYLNSQGQPVGGVVVGLDHSLITSHNQAYTRYLTLIVLTLGLAVILTLYINLVKVKNFLSKLKRMIIASHSNDFSDRFETDPIHCLDVMSCHNEECPVYENPSLVCYLETGSEAISPEWRDTCIFLNKYESCSACPVYALKKGDELDEMRNVINTMMRLWSIFLDRSGRLLSQVLRSEGSTYHVPSLDDVATRMEQMAKLTTFSHDIRGVYQKEEVYEQLENVFQEVFKIDHYILFEVNQSQNRMTPVVESHPESSLCKTDVLISPEICRAKRMSEEVSSANNPALCPHFNCDHSRYVRYCIPLVMGGQVGTVFSFLVPRSEWHWRREQVIILRKYMEETAPILTTLRLLDLTREQSLRDPLTHCQNRRFLDEFIKQYEPLSIREEKTIGFLMADLDYFKQVNDQYGHQAGDAMLKQVVSIIRDGIRSSDLLIRYGGEEFLILLPQVEPGMSEAVAEKIRVLVEQFNFETIAGITIKKTISLGVAEFPHDADTMYKAIKFSDVALYEAKKTGRNRVVRFKKEMWTTEEY